MLGATGTLGAAGIAGTKGMLGATGTLGTAGTVGTIGELAGGGRLSPALAGVGRPAGAESGERSRRSVTPSTAMPWRRSGTVTA